MKYTFFLIATLFSTFSIGQETIPEKNIGVIVYSVLSPDQFRESNGNGWFLMDGGEDFTKTSKIPYSNTPLYSYGFIQIPDVRGYFIRSHDNREENRVDVDRKSTSNIASIQKDAIASHKHDYNDARPAVRHRFDPSDESDKKWPPTYKNTFADPSRKTAASGGNETRPLNINLYTYIKVY